MESINSRIKQITSKYEELRAAEDPSEKQQVALSLIKLCAEAQLQIQKQNPSSLNFRQKSHVSTIKERAIQVNKECDDLREKKKRKFDLPSDSKIIVDSTEQELSKKVGRIIVEKEVKSRELKATGSDYEQIAKQMERNLQVQEQIKSMIVEQGGDIELIEKRLDKAYENITKGNADLTDAAQIQLRNRLAKIRLGITGLISLIGYGILGIPGMIFGGLLGLFKTVA